MKKILSILVLLSVLTILVTPLLASAALGTPPVPAAVTAQCTMHYNLSDATWEAIGFICPVSGPCLFSDVTKTCAVCCVMNTVYGVSDWAFVILMILVTIFVIVGGIFIVTAGADPAKVNTGRLYLIWALVGGLIAIFAKTLPQIARSFLGVS